MKSVLRKLGLDAKNIWMGTFHSIFAKILRFEADKIGYLLILPFMTQMIQKF